MPSVSSGPVFRRLARDHAAAGRLRVPVSEYREMRTAASSDQSALSRRELLKIAGAAGLGVVAAGLSNARAPRAEAFPAQGESSANIVVVGAGIAGLTAALILSDHGVASTVYEANPDRVGGRMYSQGGTSNPGYWDQGQVSEWGGELIDTDHHEIRDLCRRFSLPLVSVNEVDGTNTESILWFQGKYYPYAQAESDFAPVWQAIRHDLRACSQPLPTWSRHNANDIALDNMSVRDWIDSRVPGGSGSPLGSFLDVGYTLELGADTTEQSAFSMLSTLAEQTDPKRFQLWGESDERFHIAGGNDQLPRAIEGALPDGAVRMGHTLLAVEQDSTGSLTLTFAVDGGSVTTVRADHVVLAVPLPILRDDIDLSSAGLDRRMRGVLQNLGMGDCSKLNMQFDSRPWNGTGPWPGVSNGECFTDGPFQQFWDVTRAQRGSSGILVQYGAGTLADAINPSSPFTYASAPYTARRASETIEQIEQPVPGLFGAWKGKATLSAWRLNPYSRGAYSYWPVGYVTEYAGYEGEAQGNLHFAGEHTSTTSQGYMNGGAETGARAAQEVLTALGRKR